MGFTSKLYPSELVIDDSHSVDDPRLLPLPGMSKGLELGLRGPDGYGASASPFPSELLIPESEWEARIKEQEERKSRLSDLVIQAGLPCKDQNGTNYCWGNAAVHCVEIVGVLQNQAMTILSPASVCAPIKGYRNSGGWGGEALQYIIDHGVVPVDKWPANAIKREYDNAETQALRAKYKVTEWYELRPRNKQEFISCLLHRMPVAKGLNWWSHEITGYDAVWINGEIGSRDRNSWSMSYGDRGFLILQGNKMLPDDAVAPRVRLAA